MRAEEEEEGDDEEDDGEEESEAAAAAEEDDEGRAARIPSAAGRGNTERREKAAIGLGVRGGTGGLLGGGLALASPSERSGEDAKRSDSVSSKGEEEEEEGEGEGEVRRERSRLGLKAVVERGRSIEE